jgi:hypothetical protein
VISFTPLPLYPRGNRPRYLFLIGVWVGPRARLDDMETRKFLSLPGLELDPSVIQPVASRYTDYAIHLLYIYLYFERQAAVLKEKNFLAAFTSSKHVLWPDCFKHISLYMQNLQRKL